MSTKSWGGYDYFITFTDHLSRYNHIYFLKHMSKSFKMFKEFQREVKN